MKRIFAVLFTLALLASAGGVAGPSTAYAQETTKSAADEAFDKGMSLMGEGNFADACEAFAKSEDPAPTIGTQYQLGHCHERQGKFVTARMHYKRAAEMAEAKGDDKRAKVANKRVKDLTGRGGKIIVIVPEQHRVQGLTIKAGSVEFSEADWGKPVLVDPGKQSLEVSAPGYDSQTIDVDAPDGGQPVQVGVPPMTAATTGPPPPPPGMGGEVDPNDDGMKKRSTGLFWTGFGLTIGGGLGTVVGVLGIAAADELDLEAPGAIALTVGGTLMLATGITFMVVFGKKVPKDPPAQDAVLVEPLIGPTGGGVRLRW